MASAPEGFSVTIDCYQYLMRRYNRAGETPWECLFEDGLARLRSYHSRVTGAAPLLLVPPVAGNTNLFDLHPDYSAVRLLQTHGFTPYLLEWGEPSVQDNGHTLNNYYTWLRHATDTIRARHGLTRLPLVGFCGGGLLCALHASLTDDVSQLVMINAPLVATSRRPLLNRAIEFYRELNAASNDRLSTRRLPARLFSMSGQANTRFYQLINPLGSAKRQLHLLRKLPDRQLAEVTASLADGLNMTGYPGALILQMLDLELHDGIVNGRLEIEGTTIDLTRATAPLLCCLGEHDKLAPPAKIRAGLRHLGSTKQTVISTPGGHIASAFGADTMQQLWSRIADWLTGTEVFSMHAIADTAPADILSRQH
jgi:poly(3-hydroxyalkanoate) synthetase